MQQSYFLALLVLLAMAVVTWVFSVYRRNVNYVDSLWSLMFLAAATLYLAQADMVEVRQLIVFSLVALWAMRLSIHLSVRNWGQPEDRRYQEIRRNNPPFALKSLYIVFGLQSVLAWIISIPLLIALSTRIEIHLLDYLGVALWVVGFGFETLADWQLLRFQRSRSSHDAVLDKGLWRYSRHPNYFGEFCIWWGFYLFAVPAGGWWTVYAPLLMTALLLKVSGVGLMERDIGKRRPAYRRYVEVTNAFFRDRPTIRQRQAMRGRANDCQSNCMLSGNIAVAGGCDCKRGLWAKDWNFDVFLDDTFIGTHRFKVLREGREKRVESVASFNVKSLFVTLYRYRHQAIERWREECLMDMQAQTETNGDTSYLRFSSAPRGTRIETEAGERKIPSCVRSFAYRDLGLLRSERLLNSETGAYEAAKIVDRGRSKIPFDGSDRDAQHFQLVVEDAAIDLWYSEDSEWLALQSNLDGGRRISYRRNDAGDL